MTATDTRPEEVDDVIGDEFDPATTTVEYVMNVASKKECADVLDHYKVGKLPASWKLSQFRSIAAAAVAGNRAVEDVGPESGDRPEDQPTPDQVRDALPDERPEDPVHRAGTEIETRRPDAVNVIPDASKWQQIVAMSVAIHKSGLCPDALKKPEDVAVVLLAANDLGIPLTQALDKIYVIDGKKGMAAELMIALAQRDGHVVQDAGSDDKAGRVYIRRRDTGAESTTVFTIEQAVEAGLVTLKDGKPYARSQAGKKKPWESFTADMLWARAVSRGCRRMVPDVLAGVSYTPDELGYIDADDTPAPTGRNADATVTIGQRRQAVAERISSVKARCERLKATEVSKAANDEARRRGLKPIKEASAAGISAWEQIAAKAEEALDKLEAPGADTIDEAEVVEDGSAEDPDATDQGPGAALAGAETTEAGVGAPNRETGTQGPQTDKSGADVENADPEVCDGCLKAIVDGESSLIGVDGKPYHVGHEPL